MNIGNYIEIKRMIGIMYSNDLIFRNTKVDIFIEDDWKEHLKNIKFNEDIDELFKRMCFYIITDGFNIKGPKEIIVRYMDMVDGVYKQVRREVYKRYYQK